MSQRLLLRDTDKRIVVKLDKSIRGDAKGIMTFGKYNNYPQVIERIINSSVSAKSAARIYSKFLAGGGFEQSQINNIAIGKDVKGKEITILSLLRSIAESFSFFNGTYIHTNLTLDRKIKSVKPVPFKYCRFAKIDDKGYTALIAVYENWEKDKDQKFDKNKIAWYNLFNLDQKVFVSQVKKIGGIEKYKGQIYHCFLDNQYLYPLSPIDDVYMDCDTEFQIQLYKNRQVRDGFFDKLIMRIQPPENEEERNNLKEKVTNFLGADGDSTIVLEDEIEPETGEIKPIGAFKFDQVKGSVNDKLFENWERGLTNNIRKAYSALPAILIDYEESKLGTTSGEAIIQATNFYNAMTQDDRATISQIFEEIFTNFDNEALKNNKNWNIKPLSLYGTTTNIQ